jgi:hypothetical protein
MRVIDPDEPLRPVDLGLSRDELSFITDGLGQWGGPAQPQSQSAAIAGFEDVDDMGRATERLRRSLRTGEPLTRRDWRRVVVLTELIFGSDTFGAGVEWETVTGRDEIADLALLREVQRKLVAVCPRA